LKGSLLKKQVLVRKAYLMHHKHPNKFVEKIAQNTSSEVLQSTSKYSRTYPKPQKLHNISI